MLEYWHWQCRMPRCWHPAELGGRLIDKALLGKDSPWAPSVDHKVRRCDGGSDDDHNLRPAHKLCNTKDATRLEQLARGVAVGTKIGTTAAQALLALRDTLSGGT